VQHPDLGCGCHLRLSFSFYLNGTFHYNINLNRHKKNLHANSQNEIYNEFSFPPKTRRILYKSIPLYTILYNNGNCLDQRRNKSSAREIYKTLLPPISIFTKR
jgi:hypothetical protein